MIILSLIGTGCVTGKKNQLAAPINIPKPAFKRSADRLDEGLRQMSSALESADNRAEKIKILINSLETEE